MRAIKTFEGKPPVEYTLSQPNQFEKIIIEKDVASVRPIVMGAVLRNVTFTEGIGQNSACASQWPQLKQN